MATWSTGKVERFLGLPSSTLRHWEREFGLLDPRRDAYGRRLYSDSDLRVLLRLRHLALRRGLGLSAAREELLSELLVLSAPRGAEFRAAEYRARIAEIRGELLALWSAAYDADIRLARGLDSRESRKAIEQGEKP